MNPQFSVSSIILGVITLSFSTMAMNDIAFMQTNKHELRTEYSNKMLSPLFVANTSSDAKQVCSNPQIISERVFKTDKRPIILFDGVCNLCNGAVNLALDWDPKGKLRFSALQSNVGRALLESNGRKSDDISSIVLVTDSAAYTKSDAILKISQELAPPFLPMKQLSVIGLIAVPKILRDLIYDGVADNRYDLMGKRNSCRFDADGDFDDRFVKDELTNICFNLLLGDNHEKKKISSSPSILHIARNVIVNEIACINVK